MNQVAVGQPKTSFAQCGEDLIVDFLFKTKGIAAPSYVDIGAYDPFVMSNTALFSSRGAAGVNIEANPLLLEPFKLARPGNLNLNVGIGPQDSEEGLEFYIMAPPAMSTFSAEEAARLERDTRIRQVETIRVPTMTVATLLARYLGGHFPDFLSCDIECFDEVVVDQLAYVETHALPKVICIETLTYSEHGDARKKSELIEPIVEIGYSLYADTYINSIFRRNGF